MTLGPKMELAENVNHKTQTKVNNYDRIIILYILGAQGK